MYRGGRSGAGKSTQKASNYRGWWNAVNQSSGAAGPCVSLITGKMVSNEPVEWPIFVTVPHDAGIKVLEFANREKADRAGFLWVGRRRQA